MSVSHTVSLGLQATWAALHVLQFGLAISGLNGVQDAVTCGGVPGGAELSDHWLTDCVPMSVSHPRPPNLRARARVLTPSSHTQASQFGLVVAIFTVGGLVGALGANSVTERLGRIGTLRLSAAAVGLGSMGVGLANSVGVMIAGR